jgi:hypothetical protein
MTRAWLSGATIVLLTGCGSSIWLHMCTTPENELRVQLASGHETLPNPRFTVFDPMNPLDPRYDILVVTDFTDYPEHYSTVWHTVCQREWCAGGQNTGFSYGEKFAEFTETVPVRPLQVGRKYVLGVDRMGNPGASGRTHFGVEADGSLREYRVDADGRWRPIQDVKELRAP